MFWRSSTLPTVAGNHLSTQTLRLTRREDVGQRRRYHASALSACALGLSFRSCHCPAAYTHFEISSKTRSNWILKRSSSSYWALKKILLSFMQHQCWPQKLTTLLACSGRGLCACVRRVVSHVSSDISGGKKVLRPHCCPCPRREDSQRDFKRLVKKFLMLFGKTGCRSRQDVDRAHASLVGWATFNFSAFWQSFCLSGGSLLCRYCFRRCCRVHIFVHARRRAINACNT